MHPVVRTGLMALAITAAIGTAFHSAFADLNPQLTFENYYGYGGGGYPGYPGDPGSGYPGYPGDPGPSPSDPGGGTGIIGGVFTNDAGVPEANATVYAQPKNGGGWRTATTDTGGHYTITDLQPGRYYLEFNVPGTSLLEYAPRQTDRMGATEFTVSARRVTTVNERALPVGTVTGRFTNAHGVGEAVHVALDPTTGGGYADGDSDASGTYAVQAFAGTYTVGFGRSSGAWQYAYGQPRIETAARITVTGGASVTVNETGLPTGEVSGRILDANGLPAVGAQVFLSSPTAGDAGYVNTAPDGSYTIANVPVGTYVAWLSSNEGRHQYVQGTLNAAKAMPIAVTADHTTVVNDTFLPTGALTVRATDATTKKPLANFCVALWNGGMDASTCSKGTGTVTVSGLPEGDTYTLAVYTDGHAYLQTYVYHVAIRAAQTANQAVALSPAAAIKTTVLDATTHQPVAQVCIAALTRHAPSIGEMPTPCTDAQGNVEIDDLAAGTYNLFAQPADGVHGAQWLGAHGGVGDQYQAKQVQAGAGVVTPAPTIYLDRAGTVSGTVRDATSGAPVPGVCVQTTVLSAYWDRAGDCAGTSTDSAGRYSLSNLGPYAWPLDFGSRTYAWQWSGGSRDQRHAKPVKVAAGASTTVDMKLAEGTTLTFHLVAGSSKTTVLDGSVGVFDAETGQGVGSFDWAPDGSIVVHALPGVVRIQYDGPFGDGQNHWYRDASDFDHASRVTVGNKDLSLDLALPDQ